MITPGQQHQRLPFMFMASLLSFTSIITPHFVHRDVTFRPKFNRKLNTLRCNLKKTTTSEDTNSEEKNVFLKLAWYSSELLGIAASFIRSPQANAEAPRVEELESGAVDRSQVAQTIKEDFQRSYFVTGNLTFNAYEQNCEFADPAGSFKGLRRFKRNCSNFGSLVERSNMKLVKWEDFGDKGIGHWRFSCVLLFPWKPILSATGYTEYYFDPQSGRVCRHVEHWNVPKMTLFKQILRPSRGIWNKQQTEE
ncbi:hypothetical protein GIB67_037203 [Kingdonia uniflora]|uniref:Uncharacterized protein n=1 Tax=Kingdonia uniflora TaxID=39325 RepID=A0A7J7MS82_9MAGN|nr:hypothetical protein GIB67_037203 [Kingdonia uniflora]